MENNYIPGFLVILFREEPGWAGNTEDDGPTILELLRYRFLNIFLPGKPNGILHIKSGTRAEVGDLNSNEVSLVQ